MVLELLSLPAFTLKGNAPHHLGIANFKTSMKITKKRSKGQTSDNNFDHRDASLNFTSTVTAHVMEIHRSLNEVPRGFFVSKTFVYCSTRCFFMVIKETEAPVSRYSYHLREVSSSRTILVNTPSLYCFRKSFNGTSLVSRTTSMTSSCTLMVL